MITFIEGGMTPPIGRITKDYLIAHRLCPHQCSPNLFRVFGSVDALNKKMGLRLTGTTLTLCTNDIRSLAQGITSSLGPQLLGSYCVFPSLIRAWKTTTLLPLGNGTMVFTTQLRRESKEGCPRVRPFDTGLSSLVLLLFPLVFHFFLMISFIVLTMILLLSCFCR